MLLSFGFWEGAWWGYCHHDGGLWIETIVNKALYPPPITDRIGKVSLSFLYPPGGDKSLNFKNDGYDAAGMSIQELEMLVLLGLLMEGNNCSESSCFFSQGCLISHLIFSFQLFH